MLKSTEAARRRVKTDVESFPYRSRILRDDLRDTYNQFAVENDVVWIADTIHITEPHMTNGGDVLLFAESIIIDAPIDTRVQVGTYGPFWEVGGSRKPNIVPPPT